MTLTELMRKMNAIPYSTLQAFIEESYSDEEYEDFHIRSVANMERHDPKGFRIDEILSNILYGDEDLIVEFIKTHLK